MWAALGGILTGKGTAADEEGDHSSNMGSSQGDVEIVKVQGGRPKRAHKAVERFDQQRYDSKKKASGKSVAQGRGYKGLRVTVGGEQVVPEEDKPARKKARRTKAESPKSPPTNGADATSSTWQCHKCNNENPIEKPKRCGACRAWRGGKRESCSNKKKKDEPGIPAEANGKSGRRKKSPRAVAVMDIEEKNSEDVMSLDEDVPDASSEAEAKDMDVDVAEPAECEPVVFSEDTLPPALYGPHQRVYAKDDATGLLYPALVRKVIWGPKSNQVSLGFASSALQGDADQGNNAGEDDEEDEDEDSRRWNPKRNCWHYFVHYMGWAVIWDRWVEEPFLYEDSESTSILAKTLMTEYKKVKPKRKGQKMSIQQVNKWMKQMVEIEDRHTRVMNGEIIEEDEGDDAGVDEAANEDLEGGDTKAATAEDESSEEVEEEAPKPKPVKGLNQETLQKMVQLREEGLQLKRKKTVSDKLTLPFNLKKVLVDEWEVINKCDMVHNLPSKVTVRDALNQYLESKLEPLRKQQQEEQEGSEEGKPAATEEAEEKSQTTNPELGKEWVEMVEGIALFFDQALPAHLLYDEERSQYRSLRKQILAQRRNSAASAVPVPSVDTAVDDEDKSGESNADGSNLQQKQPAPADDGTTTSEAVSETTAESPGKAKSPPLNLLPDRTSEIYGCEHLLRLFVRLPSILAESPDLEEMESRRISSKLGDLVRYLQKNQSQIFQSSFGRPVVAATGRRAKKEVGGK